MSIVTIKVIVVLYLSNGNCVSHMWSLHEIALLIFRTPVNFPARPLQSLKAKMKTKNTSKTVEYREPFLDVTILNLPHESPLGIFESNVTEAVGKEGHHGSSGEDRDQTTKGLACGKQNLTRRVLHRELCAALREPS